MKLNKDNLIGVIIGFIVLVIFAICLSSGCAKRITPVPEIRYVPVTDSTAVNELVLTKELLRRTQDSLNSYKSDTTISADYFIVKYGNLFDTNKLLKSNPNEPIKIERINSLVIQNSSQNLLTPNFDQLKSLQKIIQSNLFRNFSELEKNI